jgi:hypothetical protein
MPRKRKAGAPRRRRRRMRGGRLTDLGQNNIDALNRISVGENNLAAIQQLEMPKPPMQPLGQVPNLGMINVGQIANSQPPLLDRVRGYLKRTKVISRGARKLGLSGVADFAEQRGYGRRRHRRQRGGAFLVDGYGAFVHNF